MRNPCLVLLPVFFAVVAPAWAAPCSSLPAWPHGPWPNSTAQTSQTRAAQVKAFEDHAFKLTGTVQERRGPRADGVVIIKNGELVYEKYARGYSATTPHLTWSVSKSLMNAAVGMAVHRGLVRMEDSACAYRSFQNQDVCRVTLDHLLQWGSGLYWKETYENESPRISSVAAMLYGVGAHDMAAFAAGQGGEANPGARFNYSSGDTVILGAAMAPPLQRALGADWLWTGLFSQWGDTSSVVETDAVGTPVGSSYWYATPRDMARLGHLFLRDGCVGANRVLPEGWVARSTQPNAAFLRAHEPLEEDDTVPGLHWWLNQPHPGQQNLPLPDVPPDMFAAEGHWGQFIWVIPSRQLVIVRTADDRDDGFDANTFLRLAMEVAP